MSVAKRVGIMAVAATVLVGAAGCQDGDTEGKKTAGAPRLQNRDAVTEVVQAAYRKTAEARTARVRMTVEMSGSAQAAGTMEMSGVMGWDPTLMDMTMKMPKGMAGAGADMPGQIRMRWLDDAMYMDLGAKAAQEMDGKRWMKMDLGALAEASGDKQLQKQMTRGLEDMNQSPAQQLALLLDSPNLKHVGPEKVGGVEAQHYKGTLTFQDMVKSDKSLEVLTEKERQELVDRAEKSGIKGYDTEVWVDGDGFPVKMDLGMTMPQGTVEITANYSDYGVKAAVVAPPAAETFDFMKLMEQLGAAGAGPGADGPGNGV
ncbi:hypothetical protein [Streptomyces lavendofoliae]|uniref:Lipoprotein n=1 Tax=Streptomyces lavendofoliae TaxID=67314 RepID=A0A918HXK0_9ACTN|nr:hypothetical protein [Streptomyces lavendofoliae]GGU34678.1 putative lipoprotein [Streptomyces lavendofoliae]